MRLPLAPSINQTLLMFMFYDLEKTVAYLSRKAFPLDGGNRSPIEAELPIEVGNLSSIPCLEYLGLGYDEVARLKRPTEGKGGSDVIDLDESYKSPVLQLSYRKGVDHHYNNTFQWELPQNVYAWSSPSCELNENADAKKENLSDKTVLNANVTADIGELKANAHREASSSNRSSSNKKATTANCTSFVAGTWLNSMSDFAPSFTMAVEDLVEHMRTDEECNVEEYGNEVCNDVLKHWFEFFRNHGTHVITRITLGGSLNFANDKKEHRSSSASNTTADLSFNINIESKPKKDEDATPEAADADDIPKDDENASNTTRKVGINANAGYSREKGSSNRALHGTNTVDILGGTLEESNGIKDFKVSWARSTMASPMPTKMELTPLALVFETIGYKAEYEKALHCYAKSGTDKNLKR